MLSVAISMMFSLVALLKLPWYLLETVLHVIFDQSTSVLKFRSDPITLFLLALGFLKTLLYWTVQKCKHFSK